jgi:hypothetical protein
VRQTKNYGEDDLDEQRYLCRWCESKRHDVPPKPEVEKAKLTTESTGGQERVGFVRNFLV